MIGSVVDISNAFQSNIIDDFDKRRYVTLPPYYLTWFATRWPNHPILQHSAKDLVLQTLTKVQGEKDSGHDFFDLLIAILTSKEMGMKPLTTNRAIFSWTYKGSQAFLAVTTDDLLIFYQQKFLLDHFIKIITKYCRVTVQSGPELSYLNLRIIQSTHGISIDQTQHIEKQILSPYWKDINPTSIYFRKSPFPLETSFEKELHHAFPLDEDTLKDVHKKHHGSLPKWVGALMHVVTWT